MYQIIPIRWHGGYQRVFLFGNLEMMPKQYASIYNCFFPGLNIITKWSYSFSKILPDIIIRDTLVLNKENLNLRDSIAAIGLVILL